MIDHESRLIEVLCPIDARIRFQRDAQGYPSLVNALGDSSPIRSKHLGQMVTLVNEREWRHPTRPILQIVTPYFFLADEPVWLTQLPPLHVYHPDPWPGILIGGRYPIDVWPRTLIWAFEWHDPTKVLALKRGDPWFIVRFETMDPGRRTRLVKAKLTPALDAYLRELEGVTNYVRGTFGLFEAARNRRPKKSWYENNLWAGLPALLTRQSSPTNFAERCDCPALGIMPLRQRPRLHRQAGQIDARTRGRTCRCRPRSEPGAGDRHRVVTIASAVGVDGRRRHRSCQ